MNAQRLAVFIDADNVSAARVREVFTAVCRLGDPIVRRAYGMPTCFHEGGGWQLAQREYGIVSRPQISNLKGKNAADIALVIDAMECLYRMPCDGICIVSQDSDYTALATKIRENGKNVYGIGEAKAPISFRSACTQYIVLPSRKVPAAPEKPAESACPRCGAKLAQRWTKSRKGCSWCPSCGGMAGKISLLKKSVAEETLAQIVASAKAHAQPGCVCPDCGRSMSIVKVASGKKSVEIDVCPECRTIWYDRDEFEALAPSDGLLSATVSAGKGYRREVVTQLAADLREGRLAPKSLEGLKSVLVRAYHAPSTDVKPILDTLRSLKVITVAKNGALSIIKATSQPKAKPQAPDIFKTVSAVIK